MGTSPLNVLAICAGAGGLELGIKIAEPESRVVAYVEREAAAAAILAARMEAGELDAAPIWSDLGTFDGRPWRGLVDCVASGDPCQPNSNAGQRRGADDERFLIEQVLRVRAECGAPLLFRENVPGNAEGQLEALVGPLERVGASVAAGIFSAEEVGAAQLRQRLFVMAYCEGLRGGEGIAGEPSRPGDGGLGQRSGELEEPPRFSGRLYPGQWGSEEGEADAAGPGDEVANAGDGLLSVERRGPQRRDGARPTGEDVDDTDDAIRWTEQQPQQSRRWRSQSARDGGEVAHPSDAGLQGSELGGSRHDGGDRQKTHGAVSQFCSALPLFAPGPGDQIWRDLIEADPLMSPAIGSCDIWRVARRNLGLPELGETVGRRGGMAWDLDAEATARVVGEVRRVVDELAPRVDRLRAVGNGVVPLVAAYAWRTLGALLAASAAEPILAETDHE